MGSENSHQETSLKTRFWVVHAPFPFTHTLAEGSEINCVKLQMETGNSLTRVREGSSPTKSLCRRLSVGEECLSRDGCSGRQVSEAVLLHRARGWGRHCLPSLSAARTVGSRAHRASLPATPSCGVQSLTGRKGCHPEGPGQPQR